jgi:hypothetical protein
MELIDRYRAQYSEFTNIDEMNLEQRAKRVPAEKHFWADKLIESKREKYALLKQKKKLKDKVIKGIMNDSPVALDKKTLDKIDDTPELEEINEKIQEQEFLIEFLELLMKNVSFIAQDIKNIIELKKIELL